jgi:CRP-like cAMP-binding protein
MRGFLPAELDPLTALSLAAFAVPRLFKPKEHVLSRLGPADALWLLAQGVVSIGAVGPTGNWLSSRTAEEGEWVDVTSAWLGGKYVEGAIAMSDCLVYELPLQQVESLARHEPRLVRVLLTCVSGHARRAAQQARFTMLRSVPARLAEWLLRAARKPGSTEVVLRQSKRCLASELGTSPETLSRTLRRLCEEGFIEMDRANILLRDPAGLHSLVGSQLAHGASCAAAPPFEPRWQAL